MRTKFHILLIAAMSVMACGGALPDTTDKQQNNPEFRIVPVTVMRIAESAEAHRWADSVYSTLTLRQRIGQLMMPTVGVGKDYEKQVERLVGKYGVGGLLFDRGTTGQYQTMARLAQHTADLPVLIAIDGEWGPAMRVSDIPAFPKNMGLGAIGSPDTLLADYGREIGRMCRNLGVHINFAPVADINSRPSNPVIGSRSFGESPERVSRCVVAYSRGLEEAGVLSVAKHFPGHGDTSVDSHVGLPAVDHSRAMIDSVDIAPFSAYINASLGGIMVGHLSVPALDPTGRPASMSRSITSSILADSLNFDGLIFTDALAMAGARTGGNRSLEALKAGATMMLGSTTVADDIDAVEQALLAGEITESAVESRVRKVLRYKYALCRRIPANIGNTEDSAGIVTPATTAMQRSLADAMITVIRNDSSLIPVPNRMLKSVAVVSIGASPDNEFDRACSRFTDIDSYHTSGHSLESKISEICNHDIVIIPVFSDAAWAQTELARFRKQKNIIPVFFTSAYRMDRFRNSLAECPSIVAAYEDLPDLRHAAAMAVFGGIATSGRLPVNLRLAPLGSGCNTNKIRLGYVSLSEAGISDTLTQYIDSVVAEAIDAKAFPGCQLLVAHKGNIIIDKAYGTLDYKASHPVSTSTLYDLASVSKVTGTLPGLMKAYDLHLYGLDDKISEHITALATTDKADITVRQMLYHESGIPAAISAYDLMMDSTTYTGPLFSRQRKKGYTVKIQDRLYGNNAARLRRDITSSHRSDKFPIEAAHGLWLNAAAYDTVMAQIYRTPLKEDRSYRYSCLNFALLMQMEQTLTGQSHDRWVTDSIYAPLGASSLCYRPLLSHHPDEIAPTESCSFLRRQMLQGFVHDEMAAMSGGVQGNAGLFGSAIDIAKLCQMWLNHGRYGDQQILSQTTVDLFTTEKSTTCRRGLGFDKPDPDSETLSPTCPEASLATYGHTGFTGTCFWVDPEKELIYVFLCNRVHPSRNNPAFAERSIRTHLLSAVCRALPTDTVRTTASDRSTTF